MAVYAVSIQTVVPQFSFTDSTNTTALYQLNVSGTVHEAAPPLLQTLSITLVPSSGANVSATSVGPTMDGAQFYAYHTDASALLTVNYTSADGLALRWLAQYLTYSQSSTLSALSTSSITVDFLALFQSIFPNPSSSTISPDYEF